MVSLAARPAEVAGHPREFAATQLRRQVESYHPTTAPDALPFLEGQGPVAPGLDLDGVDGPEDFAASDPTGEHRKKEEELRKVVESRNG